VTQPAANRSPHTLAEPRPEPAGPHGLDGRPGSPVDDIGSPARPRRPRTAMLVGALPIAAAFVAFGAATASAAVPSGTAHTVIVAGDDPCVQHAALNSLKVPNCAGD
jgi:hypothetical protein